MARSDDIRDQFNQRLGAIIGFDFLSVIEEFLIASVNVRDGNARLLLVEYGDGERFLVDFDGTAAVVEDDGRGGGRR